MNDLIGQRFGEWLVVAKATGKTSKRSVWHCRCSCGVEKVLHRHNLVGERTRSCGCALQRTEKARFFEKVYIGRPDECWPWLGSTTKCGYGRLFRYRKSGKVCVSTASRMAYEFHYGIIPNGLCVLHSCDNPACVNPVHLHLGTHAENMHEASTRNRFANQVRGTSHHNAVLNPRKVRSIRIKFQAGNSISSIARTFGVTRSTIKRVVTRITWKEVT